MNIPYLLQVAEVCKAGILFPSNVQPISGFLHLRLKVLNQKLHHREHFSALVKHKKGKSLKPGYKLCKAIKYLTIWSKVLCKILNNSFMDELSYLSFLKFLGKSC